MERRLLEARERLVTCGSASCPALIRKDCWRWLEENEKATPGLVISIQEKGYPGVIDDVTVTLDGNPLPADWRGKAIAVDPGEHQIHVEAPGYHPADQAVVALEGAKSMLVTVELTPLVPRVTEDPSASGATTGRSEAQRKRVRIAAYVLGGFGVAVLGASTYLGVTTYQDAKEWGGDNGCKPNCSSSDVDAARIKLIGANAGFGVGAAALLSGLIMYLTNRPRGEDRPAASVAFELDERKLRAGTFIVQKTF